MPPPEPAALRPPRMRVGVNYPWPAKWYGYWLGPFAPCPPRVEEHLTPGGAPAWRDSLPRNLAFYRDELGAAVVRVFLYADGCNLSPSPLTGPCHLPEVPDPRFLAHFEELLAACRDAGLRLVPCLLDFLVASANRWVIVSDPARRERFFATLLDPLLNLARARYAEQIEAWDVMNEPVWSLKSRWVNPQGRFPRRFTVAELTAFLEGALRRIEAAGFVGTVGHAGRRDWRWLPRGSRPQYHYYGPDFVKDHGRGRRVEPCPSRASAPAHPGSGPPGWIVGEIAADARLGRRWPELAGGDRDEERCACLRLTLLAQRGYDLALLWPNVPEAGDRDFPKYSPAAAAAVRKFTRGRFPGGIPRDFVHCDHSV